MLIKQKNNIHDVISSAGDELGDCINKCIKRCIKEDCKMVLNFNGVKHLITSGSCANILKNNWYNSSFDFKAAERDEKLNKLGI